MTPQPTRRLSLRTRLSLLIVLATLPVVGLIVHGALEREAAIEVRLRADARASARDAAIWQGQFVQRTREVLVTLARLPVVRERDAAACGRLFGELLPAYPYLMNLHVAGPDGLVFCSARPVGRPIDASNLSSFRRAVETGEFALGERQIALSGKVFFAGVFPVHGDDGDVTGVVAANFSVDALSEGLSRAGLPNGAVFFSIDRDGTVLVQHPEHATWVGRSLGDTVLFAAAERGHDELVETATLDGVERLYAVARVPGVPPPAALYAAVGLDRAAALAAPRRALWRDIALLALLAGGAIAAVWFGGNLVLVRPLEQLSATLRRVGAGDLGARFGTRGADEIEIIGRAADQMAEMLERREQERLRTQWEREKLWREQEALHERLRLQLDLSPAACILTDEEARITYANPAAERIFGFTRAELTGRHPDEALGGEGAGTSFVEVFARLKRGESVTAAGESTTKDGRRLLLEWSNLALRRPDGLFIGAMLMAADITDRERTEQALARLNRELESQVRARTAELEAAVKELDAFAFSVSHDLRAPVRHVNGYLSLLKEELGEALAGQPAHYIDSALDATRHMNRLIDDLLAFSRSARAPLAVQRVELDAAVRDALAELEPETAGREIEFKIEALPPVWADPALLRVVLMNLLSNAVKYTAHRRPARIAIEAGAGGATEVVIGVHDNGVGFDMRHADKLFGVFQRLHSNEEYEGTGVGLATVQRILHRHGGRIWAEAEPDRGATFRFTLHRADA